LPLLGSVEVGQVTFLLTLTNLPEGRYDQYITYERIQEATMSAICARTFTGLALSAAVVFGALSTSGAQPMAPVQSPTALNGFPAAQCSRSADQEALRIKQLVEVLEKSRRMAVQNPLLLADVGYYEAELAASRRCPQSVAARSETSRVERLAVAAKAGIP